MSILNSIPEIWRRASLTQRVVLLGVLLTSVIAVVLLVGWARQPTLVLLYGGLSPEEAAKIVEKIRESDTPYELRNGGASIYVPEEKKDSLRLAMASQGLPAGDQAGYKILDEEKIGTSPFTQRVNYARAIQDELAKTIRLIEGVTYARVHVAKPESTLFGGKDKQASATVVLRLKPGWRLTGANVAAIVHLVAGSVEGLSPDKVVVVDNQGSLLSGTGDDDLAKGTNTFLDYKTRVEQYLSHKAEEMLASVLGPNRASVRVDAAIETSNTTQTTETYDPVKRVIAKETTKTKSSTGGRADNSQPSGLTKEDTTDSEYLVSVVKEQRSDLPGKIKSLTVAAFVDLAPQTGPDGKPTGPAIEIKDVEEIIRNAMGLRTADTLKVVNAPFRQAMSLSPEPEEQGFFSKDFLLEIARRSSLGILVLGGLVALKIFAGPRKKVAGGAGGAAGAGLPALAAQSSGGALLAGSEVGEIDPEVLRSRITHALQQNPDEVKRLFLSWAESEKGG